MPHPALLLTGFDPFAGAALNPSWEAVRRLDGEILGGLRVVAAQLPTVFGAALAVLDSLLDQHRPALVVAVGQAGGRTELAVERVALNVDDARIPDNAGQQPIDTPIVPDGPAAYFSTLPIKAMVHSLREGGIPACVSQSAGTFVCNHVFYGLQHRLHGSGVRSGFIHIPYLPEQAARLPGAPSLALDTLLAGLRLALACAASTATDRRAAGGELH